MDNSTLGGQPLDVNYVTLGGTIVLRGSGSSSGGGQNQNLIGDRNLVFEQTTPSPRWVINHPGFGKYASIRVLNAQDDNQQVYFDIESSTTEQTILIFKPAFAGKAILN